MSDWIPTAMEPSEEKFVFRIDLEETGKPLIRAHRILTMTYNKVYCETETFDPAVHHEGQLAEWWNWRDASFALDRRVLQRGERAVCKKTGREFVLRAEWA